MSGETSGSVSASDDRSDDDRLSRIATGQVSNPESPVGTASKSIDDRESIQRISASPPRRASKSSSSPARSVSSGSIDRTRRRSRHRSRSRSGRRRVSRSPRRHSRSPERGGSKRDSSPPSRSRHNEVREGDWTCPECRCNNYKSRMFCFKCRYQKNGGGSRNMGNTKPGDWICPCGVNNYASRAVCFKCNSPKVGYGMPSMPLMKPGEWMCPACGAKCFASRTECFKCHAPKPAMPVPMNVMDPQQQMMAYQYMQQYQAYMMHQNGGNMPMYFGMPPAPGAFGNAPSAQQQQQHKTGDWTCPNCQAHCFASRSSCFKCNTPKPGHLTSENVRPGDWRCPNCGSNCYASRTSCFKCHTAKP